MEIIPSIDLLGGSVVRLERGDYRRVTVYSRDVVGAARRFEQAGAKRLHIVDLDGARDGGPQNQQTIAGVIEATALKVQVAGGIRSRSDADAWFARGADRVVFGTAVIDDPAMVEAVARNRPDQVVVALDARRGRVAVRGWSETTELDLLDLAERVDEWPLGGILFTAIERDGMRLGPDVPATAQLQQRVTTTVIASGGVGSREHLEDLSAHGIRAAVCGRALYSGDLSTGSLWTAGGRLAAR